MKLVLDNREKKLYEECNKLITTVDTFKNIIIDVQALEIGDIIIKDDINNIFKGEFGGINLEENMRMLKEITSEMESMSYLTKK